MTPTVHHVRVAAPTAFAEARRQPFAADPPLAAHLTSLTGAVALLLWSARGVNLYWDDWALINAVQSRVLGIGWFFQPHNDHWIVLPKILFWLIYRVGGGGSAVPFIVVTIVLHALLAHLLWRVAVRAGCNRWLATVAVAGFALFAGGVENILFAVQMGLVGSAALGTVAFLELQRPRPRPIVVVLASVVSVMSFGLAVVFLAICACSVVLGRTWARLTYLVPAAALLTWHNVAHTAGGGGAPGVSTDSLLVAVYWLVGTGGSVAAMVPWRPSEEVVHPVLSPTVGLVAVGGASALAWAALYVRSKKRPQSGIAISFALGCPLVWALLAHSRSGYGLATVLYSRYQYAGALFVLPLAVLAMTALAESGGKRRSVALAAAALTVAASNWFLWWPTLAAWTNHTQSRAGILKAGQALLREGRPMFSDIGGTPQFAFLSVDALRKLDLDSVSQPVTADDEMGAALATQVRLTRTTEPNVVCGPRGSIVDVSPERLDPLIRLDTERTLELHLSSSSTGGVSAVWPVQLAAGTHRVEWLRDDVTLTIVDRFGRGELSACTG